MAIYELLTINRAKLENLIHRVFEPARLDIEVLNRFGGSIIPREGFLVPLFVMNEVGCHVHGLLINRDFSATVALRGSERTRRWKPGERTGWQGG